VKGGFGSVFLSWSLKTFKSFETWQAAKPCICTTCSCGKHKCAETSLTTKYQSLDIKETDKKFQGQSEYIAEYVPKQSIADRITKDGISLLGCVPTGAQYNKPTHTEYSGSYNEKPIYPAKAKKEANLDPNSCTFKGRTTYDDSYLSWPANPRSGFKPPGFHSNPMALEGKTSYTYDYWDKSRPIQPWRKSEHWPHTYSLCETHHPHKLESMPSKPIDTASRIIPYSKFAENTTYSDHYRKWRVQDSVRNVKEVRWGPKVEKFVGHTTYTQDFCKRSGGEKCNVLMIPKPTVLVNGHQCYP